MLNPRARARWPARGAHGRNQRDHGSLTIRSAQRRSASNAASAGGCASPLPQRASSQRRAAARTRRPCARSRSGRSVVHSFVRQVVAFFGAVAVALLSRRRYTRRRSCTPRAMPLLSRRHDTQPPLDAAACASCAERGVSLAPWFSAWSHARGCDGSTAARRRVAAARRSSRRRSRALLASARSAAAFATARHSAAARRGGLRFLR